MSARWVGAVLVMAALLGCAAPYTNKELMTIFDSRGFQTEERDRGVVVFLPDVFFEFDKADLTPSARSKVGEMAVVVNDPRAVERNLAVEGHTDAKGTEAYNLELSKRRAETVGRDLIFGKVAPERLTLRGYGEQYPIAPNTQPDGSDNPEGRAKNRRVEVVVLNPETKP